MMKKKSLIAVLILVLLLVTCTGCTGDKEITKKEAQDLLDAARSAIENSDSYSYYITLVSKNDTKISGYVDANIILKPDFSTNIKYNIQKDGEELLVMTSYIVPSENDDEIKHYAQYNGKWTVSTEQEEIIKKQGLELLFKHEIDSFEEGTIGEVKIDGKTLTKLILKLDPKKYGEYLYQILKSFGEVNIDLNALLGTVELVDYIVFIDNETGMINESSFEITETLYEIENKVSINIKFKNINSIPPIQLPEEAKNATPM